MNQELITAKDYKIGQNWIECAEWCSKFRDGVILVQVANGNPTRILDFKQTVKFGYGEANMTPGAKPLNNVELVSIADVSVIDKTFGEKGEGHTPIELGVKKKATIRKGQAGKG